MEESKYEVNFDETFKVMIRGMRLNRCHPDIPRDKKWLCQFIIMHGLFTLVLFILVYSTIFHDLKINDYTQACANGILGVVYCVVTSKYCLMLRYQQTLKGLMNEMSTDYETAKSLPLDEQRVIFRYAKRGKTVVQFWLGLAICAGGVFPIKALILTIHFYYLEGEFKLVHFHDVTYPSPVEEMKDEPLVFFQLFFLFLFFDYYASVMYVAMSALGPVLILHGTGQLELIRRRIQNIFDKKYSKTSTLNTLKAIVKRLQEIYSFLDRVQESFEILYEMLLRATLVIIPISFYQVIESFRNGVLRIEFISIIIGAVTLTAIPSYYSDKLMDKGEELGLAVYTCGWEVHLDQLKELRSTLLLIQSRSARPVAIRTLFRTVSLSTFAEIYNQSYAIFNLLNAVWN